MNTTQQIEDIKTAKPNMTITVKYFARLRVVESYPHNGKQCWCVVDSMGGMFPVADEAVAVTEAIRRSRTLTIK